MNLHLVRLFDNGDDTIGMLFFRDRFGKPVYCWTLEDEYRDKKVYHETRIPAGSYIIKIRTEGGHYERYSNHRRKEIQNFTRKYGVLELLGVEGFKWILIHIGNDQDDTSGCILVGDSVNNNSYLSGFISSSTDAYVRLITELAHYLDNDEPISITVYDSDKYILEEVE